MLVVLNGYMLVTCSHDIMHVIDWHASQQMLEFHLAIQIGARLDVSKCFIALVFIFAI